MAVNIEKFDKFEGIRGKIVDINGDSTLTISVISPFTCNIEFHCNSYQYDNMLHPPPFKYNWMDLREVHPGVTEASAYYNTEEKRFYKKESGGASEWKPTDFKDIYEDNSSLVKQDPNSIQERYRFFRNRYMSILQKGQLCRFSAYALHTTHGDWHSVKNKSVERHPDDYYWIYDPDTFSAEKWDAESIDDLVKEIRPSRDCLKQLLESYEDDDRKAKKAKWKRRWGRIKSTPKRIEDSIGKYPRLLWLILTFGMFLVGIGSLIVTYAKD